MTYRSYPVYRNADADGLERGFLTYGCQPQHQHALCQRRQPSGASVSSVHQFKLVVLVVVCLTIVLLFVGVLAVVSTDNVVSRLVTDELSRQSRLVVDCRPCPPPAAAGDAAQDTSSDTRCCQLDADLQTAVQKVR